MRRIRLFRTCSLAARPENNILCSSRQKYSRAARSCDTFVECESSRTEFYDNSAILAPTSNTSISDTFATVSPDVEPTLRTSVRDTFAILAPNAGPTSNISIFDKFAIRTMSARRLRRMQSAKNLQEELKLLKVWLVFGVFYEREFSGILVLGGGIFQFLDGNSRWP